MLILAAIPFYLLAIAAALSAAGKGDRLTWIALSALFAVMVVVRAGDFENLARDALRGILAAREAYGDRRLYQSVAAGLCFTVALIAVWFAMRGASVHRNRSGRWIAVARLAGIAYAALAALRLVSLHHVDALLYGPLHANRVIDPALALVVAGAAWRYRTAATKDRSTST